MASQEERDARRDEREARKEERAEAREARKLARFDADERPLVLREKMPVGVRMERTEGCLYRPAGDHRGVRKARKKQVTGEEAPDQIELTRGQLAMLSRKHGSCTPSLQCLADVLATVTTDEEEAAADEFVAKIRRKQRLGERTERRRG